MKIITYVICAIGLLVSCRQAGNTGTEASPDRGSEAVSDGLRNIYIPTTISPEAQKATEQIAKAKLYLRVSPKDPNDTAAWGRDWREQEQSSAAEVAMLLADSSVRIIDTVIGGVHALDIRPRNWKNDGSLIVYTHGGAYTMNSARSTLSSSIPVAKATGRRVISVDYTTAPFARWDRMQAQVVDVFKALLKARHKMGKIGIYGASAGGGLAVSTVLNLRDAGLGMPAVVVLWSPWADLTNEGDSPTALEGQEPILSYPNLLEPSARAYANGLDLKDPRVSPLYADFSKGFPPTLIQEGTKTTFLSTSIRLYQKIDMSGMPATIDMYEGMMHVFQQLKIPEAIVAVRKTADFLNRHLK